MVRGGTGLDKVTTDGPFVESKEHIGGFYIINAEDLDAALVWAEKVVEATNHDIEVRPFRATGLVKDATFCLLGPVLNAPGKRGPKHAPDLRRVVDGVMCASHSGSTVAG